MKRKSRAQRQTKLKSAIETSAATGLSCRDIRRAKSNRYNHLEKMTLWEDEREKVNRQ